MPTILAKKTATRTCGGCGANLSADATECTCGSNDIRKSFVLVKKAVADKDEEITEDVLDDDEDDEDDDDVEDEDLEEEDFEGADDDEDEDEKKGEVKAVALKDGDKEVQKYEALNLTTALADKITKALNDPKTSPAVYDQVMNEFCTVMDGAAAQWFAGKTVIKSADLDEIKGVVSKRLEEEIVTKKTKVERPKALDTTELPDEIKTYIESLEGVEGVEVEKAEDIYKGLSAEVIERIQKADRLVEESEQRKWDEIVKSLKHFPGDKVELAKTLRALSESNPTAYEALQKQLEANETLLAQSSIFKNFGKTGADSDTGDEETIMKSKAQKLVDEKVFPTVAQAQAHLLDQKYAATRI